MQPTLILGAALLPAAAGLAFVSLKGSKPSVSTDDLIGASRPTDLRDAVMQQSALDRAIKPALEKVMFWVRKITPMGWNDTIQQRLMLADSKGKPEFVIVQKIVFCVLFFFVLNVLKNVTFGPDWLQKALYVGKPVLGFFLPDILLKNKAAKRQALIQQALPDFLDQITVGVEAGLGFDAAMSRTAKSNEGPLAQEFMRTLQHVSAGLSRAEALRGLSNRNKVPELRQFVGAILQAEQYGVPMAQVLRVQAAEQRRKRRQRAEEKAMKLPVKVLFPLVLCILPTLFIVLIGPAGLSIAESFKGV
jgi:tight adherence protein C